MESVLYTTDFRNINCRNHVSNNSFSNLVDTSNFDNDSTCDPYQVFTKH